MSKRRKTAVPTKAQLQDWVEQMADYGYSPIYGVAVSPHKSGPEYVLLGPHGPLLPECSIRVLQEVLHSLNDYIDQWKADQLPLRGVGHPSKNIAR